MADLITEQGMSFLTRDGYSCRLRLSSSVRKIENMNSKNQLNLISANYRDY